MAKLGSFAKGNTLRITQSNHGALQGLCAFDLTGPYSDLTLYCLAGYSYWTVERVYGSGRQKGFHLVSSNRRVDILFHHCTPTKVGRVYPKQIIGKSTWHHWHIAPKVDGKWRWIFDYLDRGIDLTTSWAGTNNKWARWSTYKTNAQLPGTSIITTNEMVQLQEKIKCVTTNTTSMNVRAEPSTSSKVVGKVASKTSFTTQMVAKGTKVGNSTTWYKYGVGWVSGAYVEEIPCKSSDCSACEKKLMECEARERKTRASLTACQLDNTKLESENNLLRDGIEEKDEALDRCLKKLDNSQEDTVDNLLSKLKNWLMSIIRK